MKEEKIRSRIRGRIREGYRRATERIMGGMNNYRVKKKLHILYIYCVLIPLIITDSVIVAIVVSADRASRRHEYQNIASAVKYNLTNTVESAADTAKNIYTSQYVNNFLERSYDSPLDYYNRYMEFMEDTLFESGIESGGVKITMYADNASLVNGSPFARMETAETEPWYQLWESADSDVLLCCYYSPDVTYLESKRKVSLLRRLNFYKGNACEKVLRLDLDYGQMVSDVTDMNYGAPVYVCVENRILLSNRGHYSTGRDFDLFTKWEKIGYQEELSLYGQKLKIYVLNKEDVSAIRMIGSNLPLILFLICINALLPELLVRMINRSFAERLKELETAFGKGNEEKLSEIEYARGEDEIGELMRNYNQMAGRMNELIQTVYKDKLKEQEINIARKNAELLALHSQINPHFLFNALESIRMHSILKGETETAHMVGKLALMERQYVDWGTDLVTVEEELRFADAYLELQKYRFGDRLSYRIEAEEECRGYRISKMTVVTFVENACVHGLENKPSPGWIFVRVYQEKNAVCLEVEDTGVGIPTAQLEELREKMNRANIDLLKQKGRVGVVNACLRLKMATEDKVAFELESEEGAGTIVTVRFPAQ